MKSLIASSLALSLGNVVADARPIEVVGTGDGMELVRAISAAFTSDHPETVILVPPSIGSGGGIAAVGAGKAQIARVARPLKRAEKDNGLIARPIFRLPSAIYVNSGVPVEGLSHAQLIDIYSGKITNWSEVGGPDLRIKVVRREDTDSTYSVLRMTMPGWDKLRITRRSKIAVTTQNSVHIVRETKGAIGFGPFSRVLESSVRVLKIDGLHPTDTAYPSAVTISYVWREPMLQKDVIEFVNYGVSRKARTLLTSLGAVPIDRADLK